LRQSVHRKSRQIDPKVLRADHIHPDTNAGTEIRKGKRQKERYEMQEKAAGSDYPPFLKGIRF